jgi:hypothetical protein
MIAHIYTEGEVEGIARRLGGSRNSGGDWSCRCPAHDDRTPSLSLTLGEDGRLLWHCFAGCGQAAVHAGLRSAGVLPNSDARPAEPRPKARPKSRIVASYTYQDEQGQPLFRVTRWDPKTSPSSVSRTASGSAARAPWTACAACSSACPRWPRPRR